MVALVADERADVAAFANADEKLLRSERPLGDAAQTFKSEKSARLDFSDDKSELVHMREQHHARPVRVAFSGRDQIAEPVGGRDETEPRHFGGEAPAHAALVPAQARDQHELHRQRTEALARGTRVGRWSRSYLPAPAVSPITM